MSKPVILNLPGGYMVPTYFCTDNKPPLSRCLRKVSHQDYVVKDE